MTEIQKWMTITLPVPFQTKVVHCYLYKGPKGYVLVDAGVNTEEAKEAFLEALHSINISIDDIPHVILTHHHPDHTGLLDFFPETVNIYAHSRTNAWLEKDETMFSYFEDKIISISNQCGVPTEFSRYSLGILQSLKFGATRSITHAISEGDSIEDILPGYSVLYLPGHASSHIGLYHEIDKLLIGGDILLSNVSSNPLMEAPLPNESVKRKALLEQEASLLKIHALNPRFILAGHGSLISNTRELVEKRIERRKDRTFKIEEFLFTVEPKSVYEICNYIFPRFSNREMFLVLSEIIGHLELLAEEGNEKAIQLIEGVFNT